MRLEYSENSFKLETAEWRVGMCQYDFCVNNKAGHKVQFSWT